MSTLTIAEAVPLGAASALRLASDHGIRALLIKGAVLGEQGLRGPHESTDVDLLIDPASHAAMLEVLQLHGWNALTATTAPSLMPRHATTVWHPLWPITLDVHHYFPGFLAGASAVFERFWASHTTATVAGTRVPVPDPVAHTALAAIHYLREPNSGLAMHALPDLVGRAREVLGQDGLARLSRLASETGASEPLSHFLRDLGASAASRAPVEEPGAREQWLHRTTAAPSTPWVHDMHKQPLRALPRWLAHAVFLSDAEVDAYHRLPGESRAKARMRRVRRGVRNLPAALRSERRGRK